VLAVPGIPQSDTAGLLAQWRERGTAGQILIDPPRAQLVSLYERAGVYLQAGARADRFDASIAIAQAMATGAHILIPSIGPWVEQAGDAGRTYWNIAQAARLIEQTAKWSDAEWHQAWMRSVNRGFRYFADELVLRPLFDDWCAMLAQRNAP
jgi:hypothetical protein